MGDQDGDSDEEFQLEDILSFDEKDVKNYTPEVQLYVEKGRKLKAKELEALCSVNDVTQSERRGGAGPFPTWTKARMIRDLMASGVALDSGEEVDPSQVVPNQWKLPLAEDGDDVDEPGGDAGNLPLLSAGSSKEQAEAASTVEVLALVQELRSRLEEQEQRSQRQQLEIVRLRANKSEPAREYGVGLEAVSLRQESRGLLWPTTTNAFEAKTLTSKEYQELVRNNSADELAWHMRPGMNAEVAKYATKVEFSLKQIWEQHTKPVVSRLEPVITTLVTAHTHLENAQDCVDGLAQPAENEHQWPDELQWKVRQLEDDLVATQGRLTAAVKLIQGETARLCGDTQAAIVKKMSVGASQQLTISKQDTKNQTASMLTPSLLQTLEKQRQEQKALNHALDSKSQPPSKHQGKSGGGRGRPNKKGGRPPKGARPPARPTASPQKGQSASPRPEKPTGKGGGKGAQ
jgi:hypothetical protein